MPKSLTSLTMTQLILWRNPQGREENWIDYGRFNRTKAPLVKALFTQCMFALLTITALVETIAYAIFAFFTLPFNYIGFKKPVEFSAKLVSSASFTVIWAIGNLFFNFVSPNLLTREQYARDFLFRGGINPRDIR